MSNLFTTIIPFSNSFDDIWIIYKIPDFLINNIKIWQIVSISIWNKKDLGLVLSINKDFLWNFPVSKVKDIIDIKNENIFLSDYRIELLQFISKNYFSLIHSVLALFLPKNLREKVKKWKLDFEKISSYNYEFHFSKDLTSNQTEVYNEIKNSTNNKVLLFWVTWSWKTEIYIKLIKNCLDEWKQSLFLIPEIILWNQVLERIKKIFWNDIIILNSSISEAKKQQYFLDIYHNKAKIILWTRSAIFYPYNNLWLIIIDEEHDSSYISEQNPRYNTIEIAEKITELKNTKLLLASWTPSIKSMYKSLKWKYKLVNLLEKFTN